MNKVTKAIAAMARGLDPSRPSAPIDLPLHLSVYKGGTRKQKVQQAIEEDGYDASKDPYAVPGRDYLTEV